MKNKSKNNPDIPTISLCQDSPGKLVFQKVGNKVEFAEILELPFQINKSNKNRFRILALKFTWWFELLTQKLNNISSDQSKTILQFVSPNELIYSVLLNCPSIEEAIKIHSTILPQVRVSLDKKLKSRAVQQYSISNLSP